MGVIELVSNYLTGPLMKVVGYQNIDLAVETYSDPRLSIDCGSGPIYPDGWRTTCVDPDLGPARIERGDLSSVGVTAESLSTHTLTVDYGRRVKMSVPWPLFDELRLLPSSSERQKLIIGIVSGQDKALAMSNAGGVMVVKNGSSATLCIWLTGGSDLYNELQCREKEWEEESLITTAYMALQLSTAGFRQAWLVHNLWKEGNAEAAETEVRWIRPTLLEGLGT
ncbi:unnamed protein product [Chondrus crispus]|uniref:Uncharacterized protein n=1 Tax=Chondrus crispus TaxID=2769 RepID=R7QS77_CHOCR|nr:unnamed protein product [Chondrus crispus]CDF40240.1 unnamed protein product [Chondrus crispus]|eukprot:XP_005710534.1 unnamed protein product [Chondrus crispus]